MLIPFLGALLSAAGFGAANVVIKKALGDKSIAQVLTNSMFSGVVCLLILNLVVGFPGQVDGRLILTLAGFAVVEVCVYLTLYKAFAANNVTVATGVISTYPILSTIIAVVFLNETVSWLKVLLIIILVLGAIVLSIDWGSLRKQGVNKKHLLAGLPWVFICLLLHAVYFPALSTLTASGDWQFKLLGIKVFALLILLIVFVLVKRQKVLLDRVTFRYTALLGLLEVIGWVGLSWASSNSTGMTAIIIAIGNSAPFITAILAFLFLKEKLGRAQYLGILIIIVSLSLLALA